MTAVFVIGTVLALGGWGSLAVRILGYRRRNITATIGLGPHAAMTVVGITVMCAAFVLVLAR